MVQSNNLLIGGSRAIVKGRGAPKGQRAECFAVHSAAPFDETLHHHRPSPQQYRTRNPDAAAPVYRYRPQNWEIECPSTGSLFSLKDGSVTSWYPGNPVLAALTPRNLCKPLEVRGGWFWSGWLGRLIVGQDVLSWFR
jgi:hypothetical protein